MKNVWDDFTLSTFVAGLIAVLVGYTSSAVIVFQAAAAAGASSAEASSWLGILCVSMGVLTVVLSLKYKSPVMFAWSTPGAALLIGSLRGELLSDVIGAFVFSSLLVLLSGVTGFFEKIMKKIPVGIASAMLAGILLHFALDVFTSMKTHMLLVMSMFIVYAVGKRFFARFNIVIVLCIGMMVAWLQGLMNFTPIEFGLMKPVFTTPTLNWQVLFSIGLPLFVVTMTSQNMTGLAVMRANHYKPEVSKLITYSGLTNLLVAPFGGYALNLSALTAAICMGPEADPDPKKRYTAAISSGLIYIPAGLFSGAVVGVFNAFPKELVMAIAGLALMGTINNGLLSAVTHEEDREAAMITFFVTASGVMLFGISSAFWGLVAGSLASFIFKFKKVGNGH
nr:benzoate/H() symporter BenE family transporter [Bacteriovorax sp. HI3]